MKLNQIGNQFIILLSLLYKYSFLDLQIENKLLNCKLQIDHFCFHSYTEFVKKDKITIPDCNITDYNDSEFFKGAGLARRMWTERHRRNIDTDRRELRSITETANRITEITFIDKI
ncbi:hypothetical protein OCU04_007335 [Sclerotinia nivalis]|uniref:Uncharacterized protein n=1 Tax=Sclerotinia nivalis TaxID=352851 RepID=A0A9X0AJF5_9HELO|nr:hypothetical protein OCU04_007335 [Sclerotinia nivalis]